MSAFVELFEGLLHMSGVASLVIFTVIIVRFCLKNAPKKFSYILWALVLVRLLCPVVPESQLSTIPKNIATDDIIEEWSNDYVGDIVTYHELAPGYQEAVNAGVEPVYMPEGGSYVNVAPDGVSPAPTVETEWLPILAIIWLCGIAAMALWAIIDYFRLRLRLRTAICEYEDVYMTDAVDSPFVLGLLYPKIYLPAGLAGHERGYILLHERCHIRRGDHWLRVLAFVALALHWFNPLVWLAFVLANRDMEMSCDEAVINSLGGTVRADYSASLLSLATGRRRVSVTPLAFGEGDPKGRIENLAKWRKPGRWMLVAGALVCIVAAVCLLTDPVSKAQINIYGSVYSYSGRENNIGLLPPGAIDLGELQGIVHDSDEPPTESHYGTNLDEKYAGQPLLLPDNETLYLYDEKGFYLVFELEEGYEIPEIPNYETLEVARGDFDRDGREDYITVDRRPARDTIRIRIIDAETDIVLWSDECPKNDTQQRAYIHRIGDDGLDSLIIDVYEPATGKVSSRQFYLVDGREKVVERSESTLKLPEAGSEEEFIDRLRFSLPQNSVVLLSTLGHYTIIGPIYAAERNIWAEPAELFSGDYNHDGRDEVVKFAATYGNLDIWELWIEKPNGQVIWRESGFAEAHAGWNCILSYKGPDGLDYLVRYNPAMFQGNATYICEVFHIENGEEVVKDEWRVEFSLPTEYTEEMADFAAAAEDIISDSYILASTLGGELHVGPTRGDVGGLLPVDFGVAPNVTETPDENEALGEVPYIEILENPAQGIYTGPSYDYPKYGIIKQATGYTIMEEAVDYEGNLWGRLKSGVGWVDLSSARAYEGIPPLLCADFANMELIRAGGDYHEYLNRSASEYSILVDFRVTSPVTDVEIAPLELYNNYSIGDCFFNVARLDAFVPFVAQLDFPGDLSAFALSLTDSGGERHIFAVSLSGRNGEITVYEISDIV